MIKFSQKFAMRCTEQEWKAATIGNRSLEGELSKFGYDTDSLIFYPHQPYLVTPYKNKVGKLGTTNTPSKDERQVIESWNPDLFYALCCQQEGAKISPMEWFTAADGKIRQCTRVDNKWVINDFADGKNDAFPVAQVHKSTFEELVVWWFEPIRTMSVPEPKVFKTEVVVGESVGSIVVTDGVVTEITLNSQHPEDGISSWPKVDPKISIDELNSKSGELRALLSGASDLLQVAVVKEEPVEVGVKFWPESKPPLIGPMSFKEILNWFGEGKDVVVGVITDSEIKCVPRKIEGISREAVALYDLEKPVSFDQVYRSKEAFLLHALTSLKKQA